MHVWAPEAELVAALVGTLGKISPVETPASVATVQSRLDLQIAVN